MKADKFHVLVKALQDVDSDIGIYPRAIQGQGEECYEQRDGYKNGWNACLMEYGQAFDKVIEDASKGLSDDMEMLLCADVGWLNHDGLFVLNMNDTWAWALADAETVPADELPEVSRLFRTFGYAGLLYWVTTKRPGLRSEFHDNNRFIDFVAREWALVRTVPDSSTRAYRRLPRGRVARWLVRKLGGV